MKKWLFIIELLSQCFFCDAQYYRNFGDYFKQFQYTNQTRTVYADTNARKIYFLGEHRVHVPDSTDNILIEWDGDSLHSILTLTCNACPASNLSSMISYKSRLYVGGGNFDFLQGRETNMLMYDNGLWDTLTIAPNGYVTKMIEHNGRLYICGHFTKIGNIPCKDVAYMDSAGWHSIDNGLCLSSSATPYAMTFYHDTLYMAGTIEDTCNVNIFQLVRFNGSFWESVPAWRIGRNSQIGTLIVFQDKLYVVGSFSSSDGVSLGNNIAYFDGIKWYSPGAGTDNVISSAVISCNKLFVSGNLTQADGISAISIASWDGYTWCSLDSMTKTFQGGITMSTMNDTLYLAGSGLNIIDSDTFYRHGYWVGKSNTFQCGQYYTGIEKSEVDAITISPNPATDRLVITTAINEMAVAISDMSGRYFALRYSENEIDISSLAAGVYCLRIQTNGGTIVRRFVKE